MKLSDDAVVEDIGYFEQTLSAVKREVAIDIEPIQATPDGYIRPTTLNGAESLDDSPGLSHTNIDCSPVRGQLSMTRTSAKDLVKVIKQRSSDRPSNVKTCQIVSDGKNITVMADQNIAIKDLISKKAINSVNQNSQPTFVP